MQKAIVYNNTYISYNVTGKGKTVVLLHGFAEDSSIWKNQLTALNGYQVILIDIPGSGKSQAFQGAASLEDFAEAVDAVIQEEKQNEFVLLGHSMGGYISLAYAHKFPKKLAGLGLLHSSALADSKDKIETRQKGIAFLQKHGSEAFLESAIASNFADGVKSAKDISYVLEAGKKIPAAVLIQYYESMIQRKDHSETLINLDIPILFIFGIEDKATTLDANLPIAINAKFPHITILQNSAHMGMLEEPAMINTSLVRYLDFIFN